MKLDVALLTHDLAGIAGNARRAEALGFDGLWTSETSHDPSLPLVLAATGTTRLQLGTAIATALTRSPMVTAHVAWDLPKPPSLDDPRWRAVVQAFAGY